MVPDGAILLPLLAWVRTTLGALAAMALVVASVACGPEPTTDHEHTVDGPTMGTRYVVKMITPETGAEWRRQIEVVIEARLEDVNQKMSTWLADSEVSRFNESRDTTPFALSAETYTVLAAAQEVSQQSDGAFDITVGPLVDAWGFGATGQPPKPPGDELLAQLEEHVGFDKVSLDPAGHKVSKSDSRVRLDLSAIAKGYAVDRVAEALLEQGIDNFMIEVGGEVRTAGVNRRGQPWRIGIEQPETSAVRQVASVVPLSGQSLATSGNYRNFWVAEDGRRISHTLDPRSTAPVEHGAASVSVVHSSCMMADAWATALMVLGPDQGFEVASQQGLAVLFLVHGEDGQLQRRLTPAFEALLETS